MKKILIGMGQLQYLSSFIIGKHEEKKIKELGKLPKLHGSHEIIKLESFTRNNEALEARLMDKKYLDHLDLSCHLEQMTLVP